MKKEISKNGTEVKCENNKITVKSSGKEVSKLFKTDTKGVELSITADKVILESKKENKKLKTIMNTWASHIKNMVKGAKEGFEYKLKICNSHYPMTVKVIGDKVEINNFIGENVPRIAKIMPASTVKVAGDIILVQSADLEAAGQTAGNIEGATRIVRKDRRRFQDGIYIISKPGSR